MLEMFMFAGVGDAVMPSRASAVDDGFDFAGFSVTSSQKLQEVAAIKSPQCRHSGMFVEDNDDDDDDDDDGDDNAGNENGMLTVLLPSMI